MKIELNDQISSRSAGALADWNSLAQRNRFKCPNCASIVYSRKSRFCGVCGSNLPASFLFSAAEESSVKTVMQLERDRHRAWMVRREGRAAEFAGC